MQISLTNSLKACITFFVSIFILLGCEKGTTGSTAAIKGLWRYNHLSEIRTAPEYMHITANETSKLYFYEGDNSMRNENCYTVYDKYIWDVEGVGNENEYSIGPNRFIVEKEGVKLRFLEKNMPLDSLNNFILEPVVAISAVDLNLCK